MLFFVIRYVVLLCFVICFYRTRMMNDDEYLTPGRRVAMDRRAQLWNPGLPGNVFIIIICDQI